MRRSERLTARWAVGFAALLALWASGCNAILGITDDPVVTPSSRSCILRSDCNPNEICLFTVCSPPCAANRDCDEAHGQRCLKVAEGTACVSNEATFCSAATAKCPAGTRCVGSKCLSDCGGDAGACPRDQVCASDGVCRGGEDASVPTTDGPEPQVDGGPPDVSSSPDVASDRMEPPTDGPAGSDAPRECNPEGVMRCDGAALAARSICQDGKWMPTDSCADGMLCDTTASAGGTCATVDPNCFGHKPGDSFCNGASRIVCGPDLVTAQTTQCKTGAHCTSVATGCAACLDNEFTCDTNKLMKCKPDHSGFELNKTCATDAPCSAQAGDCTTHACSPMQKRCNGDKLEQCNADQSAFALIETCSAGLCDSQALQCDKCVARAVSCVNGMVRTCSDDGQTLLDTACPAGKPFCTGNGTCVECRDVSSCTPPNDCTTATCNAGTCGFPPKGANTACNGGRCDGAGHCVECNDSTQCTAKGECFTGICGVDHKCVYNQRAPSSTCSLGYCNAAGTCVACLGSGTCSGTKPICNAAGTCVACAVDAQCLAKATGTNYCRTATGACVACLASANCATATTPICDATSFTCRGCTQASLPTGDAECNARNGASAPACKSTGGCVKCTSTNTAACTSASLVCDTASNTCVQCVSSANCGGTTPICVSNACTACTTSAQCAAKGVGLNACNTSTGTCVLCVTNADCGGNKVCESDNTCCTPESLSVTCGASSCGNKFNNCGVGVNCGNCGMGTQCCEFIGMPPDTMHCQNSCN